MPKKMPKKKTIRTRTSRESVLAEAAASLLLPPTLEEDEDARAAADAALRATAPPPRRAAAAACADAEEGLRVVLDLVGPEAAAVGAGWD